MIYLYPPEHCYDMNYHLIDTADNLEYLIDIEEMDKGLDLEDLKEIAWKSKQISEHYIGTKYI